MGINNFILQWFTYHVVDSGSGVKTQYTTLPITPKTKQFLISDGKSGVHSAFFCLGTQSNGLGSVRINLAYGYNGAYNTYVYGIILCD